MLAVEVFMYSNNSWSGISIPILEFFDPPTAKALSGYGSVVASASPRRGRCLFLEAARSLPSSFSDL
jgi:hypothetical protein